MESGKTLINNPKLVLLWAQLTKIYLPLPISVQPISITKTLPIVPTKNYPADDYLLKFYQIPSYITKIFLWHCIKYKAPNSGTIKVNIGWTDMGSGRYILVSCAHSNTSLVSFVQNSLTKRPSSCLSGLFDRTILGICRSCYTRNTLFDKSFNVHNSSKLC
jgi:hypothetical protein